MRTYTVDIVSLNRGYVVKLVVKFCGVLVEKGAGEFQNLQKLFQNMQNLNVTAFRFCFFGEIAYLCKRLYKT